MTCTDRRINREGSKELENREKIRTNWPNAHNISEPSKQKQGWHTITIILELGKMGSNILSVQKKECIEKKDRSSGLPNYRQSDNVLYSDRDKKNCIGPRSITLYTTYLRQLMV
jgi:hypothetical protein